MTINAVYNKKNAEFADSEAFLQGKSVDCIEIVSDHGVKEEFKKSPALLKKKLETALFGKFVHFPRLRICISIIRLKK